MRALFDYAICAAAICLMVWAWGRFKKKLADAKFREAGEFLAAQDYRNAICVYQEIGSELKSEPRYWYSLAVALAGSGAAEDALAALEKLLNLDPVHEKGLKLMEVLNQTV
jgi:tetratricopeptide (TPR) repeat protein